MKIARRDALKSLLNGGGALITDCAKEVNPDVFDRIC
jgi:hypothetical protein